MLAGVVGIVEGLNPQLLRSKLEPYTQGFEKPGKAKGSGVAQPAARQAVQQG